MLPYLVLLRMGFAVPSAVTVDAVSSYLAVSPLPFQANLNLGGLFSVALSVALGLATYSTQPLTGIPPCGARTFLPTSKLPSISSDCLTDFPLRIIARLSCTEVSYRVSLHQIGEFCIDWRKLLGKRRTIGNARCSK